MRLNVVNVDSLNAPQLMYFYQWQNVGLAYTLNIYQCFIFTFFAKIFMSISTFYKIFSFATGIATKISQSVCPNFFFWQQINSLRFYHLALLQFLRHTVSSYCFVTIFLFFENRVMFHNLIKSQIKHFLTMNKFICYRLKTQIPVQ